MKDLYRRESETSTGIEDGFGIPHTKSKAVLAPTICFVHTGKISDYVGLDDKEIGMGFCHFCPSKDIGYAFGNIEQFITKIDE